MKGIKWISFPEWANDNYFYEKLVEGDKKTINLYKKLRVKGVGEKS